ncbi:MAG TPA: sigma-70 family RNA polymerase sigma factor [Candidatus Limnocylindria bacterium]
MRVAQRGDSTAFARLVVLYDADVRAITRRLIRDADDAEDMRQEVWLRVAERIQTVTPDRFRAWLRTIARNTCLNFLRTHASRARITDPDAAAEVLLAVDDAAPAPERSVLAEDGRREMWEAVGGLSEEDRIVLRLREVEERTYVEIAEMLSTTPHAAEVRTHRARGRLRRALEALMAARRQWHMNPLKIARLVDDSRTREVVLPEHVNECDECAQDIAAMRRGRELFGGLGALMVLPREVSALASRLRGVLRGEAQVHLTATTLSGAPAAFPTAFVQTGGIAVTAVFALTAVLSPVSADAAVRDLASNEVDPVALPAAADRDNDVLQVDQRTVVVTVDVDDTAATETTAVAEAASPIPNTNTTWAAQPATTGPANDPPTSAPSPSPAARSTTVPPGKSAQTRSSAPHASAPANAHVATAAPHAAASTGPATASKTGTNMSARASGAVAAAATQMERDDDASSDATTNDHDAKSDSSVQRSAPTSVPSTMPSNEAKPANDARQRRGP